MTRTTYLFLRGTVWTWRRRILSLSTQIKQVQLSLGTKNLPDARILSNRLNYEFDRMTAAMTTGLTLGDGKIYLESVIREETQRINRQRMVSRMDPVIGNDDIDRRHDWAAAQAWDLLSKRGLEVKLSKSNTSDFTSKGATDSEILTLTDTIDLLARDTKSDAGTARMIRRAKDVLADQSGPDHSLAAAVSALTILQLRHLLVSGKARAWKLADEPQEDSEIQILKILGLLAEEAPTQDATIGPRKSQLGTEPVLPSIAPPMQATAQPQIPAQIHDAKFSADPKIEAVAERVNQAKSREDCTDETRKQIHSTAALFVKVTGLNSIVEVEQKHMKYFINTLDGLPTSYGKSDKDAARTIDEILKRAEELPPEKVGLSPRTVNGHLDRLKVLMRTAKSDGLAVHDVDFGLLRLKEKGRARDKRIPFNAVHIGKIFKHPIWTGCVHQKRRHVPGNQIIKDAQYWGPMMGAYSGARREEILGLAPEDIVDVGGIRCFDIKHNPNRRLKTDASARQIPIHDHLIELGFLDHVAAMHAAKEKAIFPELIPTSKTESFGDKFFYNWDKVLDEQLGEDAPDLCFHSWRHYVITFLKGDKSVSEKERRDLAGHVGEDVHAEVYDIPTPPSEMRRVVNLLPRAF